ncbi:UNVERIFIED_ORG: ABC-type uncharacterized transport system permease subunit [Sphingomonas sp. R1F5B]
MTSPFDPIMLRLAIAMLSGAIAGGYLARLGCTWAETLVAVAGMIALAAFIVALWRAYQL